MNWLAAISCWFATICATGVALVYIDAKYYKGGGR